MPSATVHLLGVLHQQRELEPPPTPQWVDRFLLSGCSALEKVGFQRWGGVDRVPQNWRGVRKQGSRTGQDHPPIIISPSAFTPVRMFREALSGEHFLEQSAFSGESVSQNTFTVKVFCETPSPVRQNSDCQYRKNRVVIFCFWHAKHLPAAKHASQKYNRFETLRQDVMKKPKAIGETPSAFAQRKRFAKRLEFRQSRPFFRSASRSVSTLSMNSGAERCFEH